MTNKEKSFNILKRIPYEQIDKEWDEYYEGNHQHPPEAWYSPKGWTLLEFIHAWRQKL